MAAFEDRFGPDLDQFAGRKWTEWQKAVQIKVNEESSSNSLHVSRQEKEVATLKRNDRQLFGFCPAKDNFFVVVCEICKLPFKPQTFLYHFEKHHRNRPGGPKQAVVTKAALTNETPSSEIPSHLNADHSPYKHPGISANLDSSLNPKRLDKKKVSAGATQAINKGSVSKSAKQHSNVGQSRRTTGDTTSGELHRSKIVTHQTPPSKSSSSSDSSIVFDQQNLPTGKAHLSKKVHKHSSLLSKASINVVESMKAQPVNKSLHGSKHGSHGATKLAKTSKHSGQRNSSKVLKTESDNTRRTLDPKVTSNGPFVVLKNAPMHSSPVASEAKTVITKTFVPSAKNLTPPIPFREYKHHHNPQLDIVKTVDRGKLEDVDHTPVEKSPKLSSGKHPLKHNKIISSKGRRKPFDELVTEQAKAKQKLKDQHTKRNAQFSNTSTHSAVVEAVNKTTTQKTTHDATTSSVKSALDSKGAGHSVGSSKTKSSILLFPRSAQPRHIDCWNDLPVDEGCRHTTNPDQVYLPHHPTPLAVNHFGGWTMDTRHTCFNRKTHHQWRSLCDAFRDDNQGRKSTKRLSVPKPLTSLTFTPIPSASLPERLKKPRAVSGVWPWDFDAVAEDMACVSAGSYATTAPQVPLSHQTISHYPLVRQALKKSSSVDSSALARRTSTGCVRTKKLQRPARYTLDSAAALHSIRNNASHDVRDVTASDIEVRNTVSLSKTELGALLAKRSEHFAVTSQQPSSGDATTVHATYARSNSADGLFKRPDDFDAAQRPVARRKSASKLRRNSNLMELIQKQASDQNAVSNHTSNFESNFSETIEHKPLVYVKEESPLPNGLSAISIDGHPWPNSAASSSSVESLFQSISPTAETLSIPAKLEASSGSGAGLLSPTSQNVNNSNSRNQASAHANELEILISSADPPSTTSAIDTLHSLLLGNGEDDLNGSGHLLAEAAAKTGLMDVDPSNTPGSTPHLSVNSDSNLCNLDYVQLSADFRPLLDPGGVPKIPMAPEPLGSTQENAAFFSNDPTNLAELWNP